MLLVVDVGNSNVKFGLFTGDVLSDQWRIRTQIGRTSDEYASLLETLFSRTGVTFSDISRVAVASVVPRSTPDIAKFARDILSVEPLIVDANSDIGIEVRYSPPSDVGPDRLVDSVAAVHFYGCPCIVVDFGTGTTLNAIIPSTIPGSNAIYLGGAICPGIGISLDALYSRAAKLSSVEISKPESAIGSDTRAALQSGVVFGYAGQVDALVKRFQSELDSPTCPVIATGGHMTQAILDASSTITQYDPLLTLQGLRLAHDRISHNLP